MIKHWQVVFLVNKFLYFFDVKIIYQYIVVIFADELCPNDFWDI